MATDNLVLLFYDGFERQAADSLPGRIKADGRRHARFLWRTLRRKQVRSGYYTAFMNLCLALRRAGVDYRINDFATAKRYPDHPIAVCGYPTVFAKIADLPNPRLIGPGLYSSPSENPTLFNDPRSKFYIQRCEWMKNLFAPYYGEENLRVWFRGFDVSDFEDVTNLPKKYDVLIYDKIYHNRDQNIPITVDPFIKKLEELGIGRPSTYAATIQVLKDRAYVRTEKNRFFAEESGRLLTAFLERFFPRYVAYDFTAGMEDELDEVSGGRAGWKPLLEKFWKDFKPKSDEVMERKPSEVTEALDEFLSDYLFPPKEDGSDPRKCPKCEAGRLSLRGGKYGAFVACSNYPECKFTRKFAQPGGSADGGEDGELGNHPETGLPITRKVGRFGPYIEMGSGKEAKRGNIPKDIGELTLDWAVKLIDLPRVLGNHPETGEPITASIGRYGPYLAHNGKYAKLRGTAEVFEVGMNAAVVRLAEAANGGGRGARTPAEPLKTFGPHPESGGEIKLMAGRYGPYVTDGTTNATLPRDKQPEALTAEEAITLITEKAAKGPAKKGGRKKAAPKKKAPAKKAAKKAAE